MDEEEPHCSYQPNTKRAKPNVESERHESDIAIVDVVPAPVVSVNQAQTAAILKLDIDCFEEAFDYLWIRDLVSLSETCKRLNQVAGYCFQQNYLGSAVCEDNEGILSSTFGPKIGAKNLLPFIQKIKIHSKGFQYVFDVRSKLRRLKQIHILELKEDQMKRLKEFSMSVVEVLRVFRCELRNHFHEILDKCVKLKRLEITGSLVNWNWFDRKYPTLEYLKLDIHKIEGIPLFLELNPNIRKFATSYKWLWKYRAEVKKSIVKLDDLALKMDDYLDVNRLQSMCVLLNKLHENGFYSKLQLYICCIMNQDVINELSSVNVTKLYVHTCCKPIEFSVLTNLEELYVKVSEYVTDWEMLPNNLINLKHIHFTLACIDDIMPIIRRSTKMQRIKLEHLKFRHHFNSRTGIINLLALNREREQLPDAKKITLYVKEKVYLATKWAMKGNDFGLIRLKREDSFDWHHDFSF